MGSCKRRSMKVMIVEDDATIALDLAGMVEGLGYDVVGIAESARAALALSAESCPDLALVDVQIKGDTDGTEVATTLRERDEVRTFFLTAYTDPVIRDRAQASWPLGLISKPVRPVDLRTALRVAEDAVK